MDTPAHPSQIGSLEEKIALLEEAYLYAYPLVLLDVIKNRTTNVVSPDAEHAPVNQLFHARTLATPDMVSLTRPNVDTVYSQAYLDLVDEPILLHKPATDRYCSVQVFDGYSNTPAILGTGGRGGNEAATYAFVGPSWSGDLPDDVIAVPVSTNLVWLLLRTICLGADDLPGVYAVQDGLHMYPLSAHVLDAGIGYRSPAGTHDPAFDYVPAEFMQALSVQEFFTRFNRLALDNPGAPADVPALARFETVGVGAGLDFDIEALGEGAADAAAYLPSLINRAFSSTHANGIISNGWTFMDDHVGAFGTDYAYRAVVACGGFANPVSMAVYPSMVTDVAGHPLRGDRAYRLHFEPNATPPHARDGWWSLTAYTEEGRLIPNELQRYNIAEADDLPFNEDGSLDVYIQAARPNAGHERLWLPLCAGAFSLTMRIYLPDERVLSFDWKMPPLEAI